MLRLVVVKDKLFINWYGIIYRVKFFGKCMVDVLNLFFFELILNFEFFDLFEFDIVDGLLENWNVFFVKRVIEKW